MDNTSDILNGLDKTEKIYRGLLDGITEEQARISRVAESEWCVLEVICHLLDNEKITFARLGKMIEVDNPEITGWDPVALVIENDYMGQDYFVVLESFFETRRQLLALLKDIKIEDWDREGNHSEVGRLTIFEYMVHILAHDADHAAQIVDILNS